MRETRDVTITERFDRAPDILRDRLSFPGEAAYEAGTCIFSVSMSETPAVIARCTCSADVAAAIAYAKDNGLNLSVKGGGHDWAGRALCDGLVIDLAPMHDIEISADRRSAWIGGGCRIKDVLAALDPLGLAAVTGSVGAVGMAGLTLGGGYGPLIARHGLALDNMIGAEAVLADGRTVLADAEREPDLFWALRGGGGNFGVVTLMRIALHEIPQVYGGMITFPLSQARIVLAFAAALLETAPDTLTAQIGLVPGPTGEPVVMVAPLWCGDPGEGESRLAPFLELGTPASVQLGGTTYGASTRIWDAYDMTGVHAVMANRLLPRLGLDSIDIWLDAIARANGLPCAVFTHEFRGAAARIAPDATAFGLRDPHVLVEILGMSPTREGTAAAVDWVERLSADLKPMALPGGYANLLVPQQADQVAASFGANAARLAEVKRRYDPEISSARPCRFLRASCPPGPSRPASSASAVPAQVVRRPAVWVAPWRP